MLDIHSHILPYVDDGSKSMHMTHDMLREAEVAGIDIIVATPHFLSRRNDQEKIRQMYSKVQKTAYEYGIQLRLGYEVHYSMLTHLDMASLADWCIQGTNSILLEFANTTRPAHWDITVCELVRNGYTPIIVHPERYLYIQNSIEMAFELKQYGCELQLDAMALHYRLPFGKTEMKTARKLIKAGIVDYIASDAHCPEHYRQLNVVRKRLGKQWPEKGILNKWLNS